MSAPSTGGASAARRSDGEARREGEIAAARAKVQELERALAAKKESWEAARAAHDEADKALKAFEDATVTPARRLVECLEQAVQAFEQPEGGPYRRKAEERNRAVERLQRLQLDLTEQRKSRAALNKAKALASAAFREVKRAHNAAVAELEGYFGRNAAPTELCPACGHSNVRKNGMHRVSGENVQQFQCRCATFRQNCLACPKCKKEEGVENRTSAEMKACSCEYCRCVPLCLRGDANISFPASL